MTQNTDYTDADLLALLAAIEAECKKLEDPFWRIPRYRLDTFNFGESPEEPGATFAWSNAADMWEDAAHPDTGMLALHRMNKQHVEDHMRALDEWEVIVVQSEEPEQWGYLRGKAETTARLWARYMGEQHASKEGPAPDQSAQDSPSLC